MGFDSRSQMRDRADAGETLCGTVLSSADAVLAEMVAASFDFVWIDLEHSALTVRDLQILTIAVQASGCVALARLPHSDSELLTAALDAGVDGLVAPRVSSVEEAESFLARLAYPPAGRRGFAPRRGNAFGTALRGAGHPPPIGVVQIETTEGLENVSEIAAVPGVDWLLVGLADLSFELGAPLQPEAPLLSTAVERVHDAAVRSGARVGLAASGNEQSLRRLLSRRVSMLLYSSDARLYAEAVAATRRTAGAALASARSEWEAKNPLQSEGSSNSTLNPQVMSPGRGGALSIRDQ